MRLKDEMFTVVKAADASVRVRLHADHPIYGAHFPGHPITPGVCIVQMVGELAGSRVGRVLRLDAVQNLKFARPLSPTETPEVDILLPTVRTEADGTVKVRGEVRLDDVVFTKFSITYV